MARGKVIAGIDIGTEKICTIITSTDSETGKIHVIGVSSQPSKGLRKSQIVGLEETIEAITDSVEAAERMAGYTISNAFVSVSGSHITSQNSNGVVAVSEPEGEIVDEDIARVVEAARALSLPAAIEIVHVIPRDFSVDSQAGIKDPIGMTGVRLEAQVHVITGASTALRNLAKCVSEVGINVEGLVFSGLASAQAVLSETEKELGVILIDIGAGSTSMCIYNEGTVAYSAVIPVGAKNITNDLAIGMRISLKSAEKIKQALSKQQKEVVPNTSTTDKEMLKKRRESDKIDLRKLGIKEDVQIASRKTLVDGIIRPRLTEIFTLVGNEIKKSNMAGLTPAGVVITGGGAETVGIVDTCKRTLTLPARIGTPTGLAGLVEEIQSPMYATVNGLVMHAIANETEGQPRFGLKGGFGKMVSSFPVKGAVNKARKLFASLLP